jgi:O-antigen ligase
MEYFEYAKKKGKRFPWKTVAVFFTVAAFLLVSVFVIDPSKLSAVFQFGMRNSSSVRVEVYTIAVNLIRENWLTGIGPGQFPAYYQFESVRILGHVPYEWNMLHPHNLYLAFWLNLGLAGIVSLIWLVWLMFMECLKYMRAFAFGAIKEVPKIKIIGFTLMLAILVHGFLDTPFFKNDLALLFWLIAAVIFLPRQKWNQ